MCEFRSSKPLPPRFVEPRRGGRGGGLGELARRGGRAVAGGGVRRHAARERLAGARRKPAGERPGGGGRGVPPRASYLVHLSAELAIHAKTMPVVQLDRVHTREGIPAKMTAVETRGVWRGCGRESSVGYNACAAPRRRAARRWRRSAWRSWRASAPPPCHDFFEGPRSKCHCRWWAESCLSPPSVACGMRMCAGHGRQEARVLRAGVPESPALAAGLQGGALARAGAHATHAHAAMRTRPTLARTARLTRPRARLACAAALVAGGRLCRRRSRHK